MEIIWLEIIQKRSADHSRVIEFFDGKKMVDAQFEVANHIISTTNTEATTNYTVNSHLMKYLTIHFDILTKDPRKFDKLFKKLDLDFRGLKIKEQ